MTTVLFIAAGDAVGAVSRYAVSLLIISMMGSYWQPLATIMVNVAGCGLMGLAYGMTGAGMLNLSEPLRGMMLIGFLGALTTFSSFSLDIMIMVERGQTALAGVYLLGSVMLSLVAFTVMVAAVRLIAGGQ
ncbi:MAG: CrcB family protein [Alphaproteobacteria bacterium]|nr:CrcB family protein [Alphaproteobacteria bacterium]